MNTDDLTGKVIVVTGGSRGIGRAIVLGAVARGAQVAFCARKIDHDALGVQKELERCGKTEQVMVVRADVSRENDVEILFTSVLKRFGQVDVVVNNAGINRASLLISSSEQDWDEVIAINLTGAFLVAKRAIKEFLVGDKGGRIISVGSVTQNGAPSDASYAASKGGLVGLTRSIAAEYGPEGICANLIIGGYTDTGLMCHAPDSLKQLVTELCPQKRLASAEEIAAVVLFLASNQGSRYMNGEAIYVSGGLVDPPPYV